MSRPKKNPEGLNEEPVAEDILEYDNPQEMPEAPFGGVAGPVGLVGPISERGPVGNTTAESELEALRRRVAELEAAQKGQPSQNDSVVELTFIAAVSPDNVTSLGEYGSLNGVGGYIEIPRKEFGGKFMTPVVRSLLRDRSLIVCSGLNEAERKR